MSRSGGRVAFVVAVLLSITLVLEVGPARSATTLCTPDPAWGGVDAGASAELLELVNQHRAALGLPLLELSPALSDAAAWKSQHMAYYGYLEHNDPAPPYARTLQQRISDCGYPSFAAENIAQYGSAVIVMQQWLLSSAHRANIENPTFRVAGIAATLTTDGSYYWALDFGTELDVATTDPSTTPSPDGDDSATENPTPAPSSSDDGSTAPAPEETVSTNTAPDVTGELVRTRPRRWMKIRVLRNDSDVDGDVLIVKRIARRPSKGRAVIADSKRFIRYRARAGTRGRDRLTYVVADGRGGTSKGTVRIRIRR